jgi:hypothetical protein
VTTDKCIKTRLGIILVVLECIGWGDDSTRLANFRASQAPAVTRPH